jgi:formylmethanofuran dehydrogenase subunit B
LFAFEGDAAMGQAWVKGKPAALDAAGAEAAKLVAASRNLLVAGLGTDVAGARAAIALAERTGAVIDHMNAEALLRDLELMRSSGVMLTTPLETRVRADTLLLVGAGLNGSAELRHIFDGPLQAGRRILWLCPGAEAAAPHFGRMRIETVGKDPYDLPALASVLRARIAARPTSKARVSSAALNRIAAALKAARFGVAIWSAGALDTPTIAMLCGLVDDLNATTRFSALSLAPIDNGLGVLQTCGWITGLPMRTAFGRGFPEHDPWRFDGRRLVESGETDCVLWISAYRAAAPQWRAAVPTIALTGADAGFDAAPQVHIAVGRPGVDHAAVDHLSLTGTLTATEAAQPSNAISVAGAIARISSALPNVGARQC